MFSSMVLVWSEGKKGTSEEPDEEWGWKEDGKCNPIIIPYFDSDPAEVGMVVPVKAQSWSQEAGA